MDMFERFNSRFGKWYEGLFGGEAAELRPKDVLRKITTAMEENRKEGLDSKIYVPNKFVLELAVNDPEERDYLLAFLDEEELVSVLQRFMAQNKYHTRGPLDFTIAEIPENEREMGQEKLRVKVRYEKGEKELPADPRPEPRFLPVTIVPHSEDEMPTVARVGFDDEQETVAATAWATLVVTAPDGRVSNFSLTKPMATIGRSRNAANDIILDTDSMVSKTHARLERERDGNWTLYDLGSTNGITVGDSQVEGNRVLRDGDEILIGETKLTFHQVDAHVTAPFEQVASLPTRRARLIGPEGTAHVLASETWIGRAVTSDIVLNEPSVSTKHARIIAPDDHSYSLEDLGSEAGTRINGVSLSAGRRTLLVDGDVIAFGQAEMRFSGGGR